MIINLNDIIINLAKTKNINEPMNIVIKKENYYILIIKIRAIF